MKPIPGCPGYFATEDGRIWSAPRYDAIGHQQGGRWLKPLPNNKMGHCVVHLYVGGRRATRAIHRLVLETFVGPCPAGMEACHNNGDPTDNRLENLRWDTHSNNAKDAVQHGTSGFLNPDYPRLRGESNGMAKLNEAQVRLIEFSVLKNGCTRKSVAAIFGVSSSLVKQIASHKIWRHLWV